MKDVCIRVNSSREKVDAFDSDYFMESINNGLAKTAGF